MATVDTAVATSHAEVPASRRRFAFGPILVNGTLALICLLWTIPTLGLLISSIRAREDITSSGWWTALPHQEWITAKPGAIADRPRPDPAGQGRTTRR